MKASIIRSIIYTIIIFLIINVISPLIIAKTNGGSSFVMSGPVEYKDKPGIYYDHYKYLRDNAKYWFSKWSEKSTIEAALPDPDEEVSKNIRNPDVELFYELAHGGSTYFHSGIDNKNKKTSYTADKLREDMKNRPPMKFAFIGSCEGMSDIDSYTFSHEFRKGQTKDTVTVGYSGMAKCEGWRYAKQWQNEMFKNINQGYTIKYSFDLACQIYPSISEAVVFYGDETLTLVEIEKNKNPDKPELNGPKSIKKLKDSSFEITAEDQDNDQIYYKIDWGYELERDNSIELLGPFDSGEKVEITHKWNIAKKYEIKVKTIDCYGSESKWSDPFNLKVNLPVNKITHNSVETNQIKNLVIKIFEKLNDLGILSPNFRL